MKFFKGAISYRELEEMPLPEFLQLQTNATKINDQINREIERQISRQKNG
jgi:hypothetical protein